jgi:hypothetical protein
MEKYKIFRQGAFESDSKFDKRLNEICQKGWKAISIGNGPGGSVVLLEKSDKYGQN